MIIDQDAIRDKGGTGMLDVALVIGMVPTLYGNLFILEDESFYCLNPHAAMYIYKLEVMGQPAKDASQATLISGYFSFYTAVCAFVVQFSSLYIGVY